MACGLSNGQVTLKGQTRDPNTLRAQYLENGWIQRLRSKEPPIGNGMWAIKQSRDRWRHVTPEGAGGSTVGYPSDSLASCYVSRGHSSQKILNLSDAANIVVDFCMGCGWHLWMYSIIGNVVKL